MRFSKQKGGASALEAHHERQKEKYNSNPDIDIKRSKYNFHIIQPVTSYLRETNSRIEVAGCKTRKDSVRFIDTLITSSSEFFKGKRREEVRAFFQAAADFLSRKIGGDNIFSAVVHMDERTPHMHLCFTPITTDGRLSAKEIIGNRTQLSKWQDEFWSHMVKAFPDLERGESASVTGRRHIPTRVFKQAVMLTKQAAQIKAVLDRINPLNAGKMRDEAMALIEPFLPDMEDYLATAKHYKNEFERQERVIASLEKELDASKPSIKEQLAVNQLKRDYEQIKKRYYAIPEKERREALERVRKTKDLEKGGR